MVAGVCLDGRWRAHADPDRAPPSPRMRCARTRSTWWTFSTSPVWSATLTSSSRHRLSASQCGPRCARALPPSPPHTLFTHTRAWSLGRSCTRCAPSGASGRCCSQPPSRSCPCHRTACRRCGDFTRTGPRSELGGWRGWGGQRARPVSRSGDPFHKSGGGSSRGGTDPWVCVAQHAQKGWWLLARGVLYPACTRPPHCSLHTAHFCSSHLRVFLRRRARA